MSGEDRYDLSAYPLFRSVIDGEPSKAKPKRCFVIAPSDEANADVRQHADTLWKYVIQPALLDTDYAPYRIDHAVMNGSAERATIDGLLDDDLVISVLSFRSPRVFYETALAQAAARPLILMIQDGEDLTFNARGSKVLHYALDTDSIVSAVNVGKLQTAIRETDEAGAPQANGFRPGAPSLGGGSICEATVYGRSPQFTYDQRLSMMREAKSRIDMMGIANLAIARHPDTLEVVRSRSGDAVEIRILQCAPSNPGLLPMFGGRNGPSLESIWQEIEAACDAWRRIVDVADLELSITVRRAQSSLPTANALITDRAIVATPYLRSRITAESPTLHAYAGSAYHRAMSQEFDLMWSEAATVFRAEPNLVTGSALETPRRSLFSKDRTDSRGFALIRGIS
jgi:hypothetical protein